MVIGNSRVLTHEQLSTDHWHDLIVIQGAPPRPVSPFLFVIRIGIECQIHQRFGILAELLQFLHATSAYGSGIVRQAICRKYNSVVLDATVPACLLAKHAERTWISTTSVERAAITFSEFMLSRIVAAIFQPVIRFENLAVNRC